MFKQILIVFLLKFISGSSAKFSEEDNVLILTTDNFDKAIEEFPSILVEFYAPWCGHCQALAPEYAKAAGMLKDEGSDVRLGKVNADEHRKLAEKYDVQGFPTIILFKKGQTIKFDERVGRVGENIVNWLKKKTGKPVVELKNVQAAKAMIDKDKVVLVGFFKKNNSAFAKSFLEVAAETADLPFGMTSDAKVFSEYKMKKDGIVLFRKFDEGRVDYAGDKTVKDLTSFIAANRQPLITEFTEETADLIMGGTIKRHLLMFLKKTGSDFETLTENLRKAAGHFKGKCLFIYLDIELDENSSILEYFGMTKEEVPAIRLINLEEEKKMKKYKPESVDLKPGSIKKFVQGVFDGKIKHYLRSADVPEDWDAKPVKVLVGKNFEKVAKDKSKDVFLEFYSPWCPHCDAIAPIWEELGEKYKNNKSLVIAKMDATANDVEDFSVEKFPTIIWIKKGSNDIQEYPGATTLEGFVAYLESGGTNIIEATEEDMDAQDTGEGEEPEEDDGFVAKEEL